jgi:uncharacterized protein
MEHVLLWDFYGEAARPTAEHFQKHLDQFLARACLVAPTSTLSERTGHVGVVCLCDSESAAIIERALKPQGRCDLEAFKAAYPNVFVNET